MDAQELVANRLRELIGRGEAVLGTKVVPGRNMIGFDSWVDSELAHQWFTSGQNILLRAFGSESAPITSIFLESKASKGSVSLRCGMVKES